MIQLFKYKPLFSVQFKHDYYISGLSPDFVVKPSADCERVLKNYGLVFKANQYGFVIAAEVISREGQPDFYQLKKIPDDKARFEFLIFLKNPKLMNFSDLPLGDFTQKAYYFTNQSRELPDGETELRLVEDIASKSVGEKDLIHLKGDILREDFGTSIATPDLSLRQRNGSLSQTQEGTDNDLSVYFDLRDYPFGRYDLGVEDKTFKFYHASKDIISQKPFGIIELFAQLNVKEAYRFFKPDNQPDFKAYTIPFARRSTIWRYHIIRKYDKTSPNLGIVREDAPSILFKAPVASEAGMQLTIESQNSLALQEEAIHGIQLRRGFTPGDAASGFEILDHLPNPKTNLIKPEKDTTSENLKIYSDIFIYI